MTAPMPRPRSCPNCHSIGAPQVVRGVPDMPCMDVWHDAPPAPTGPEPKERAGFYEDDEPAEDVLRAFDAGEKGLTARPAGQTVHLALDADQVSALQAEVDEARRERDRARRCLREHCDCAEIECQAEIEAALGVGPDPAEVLLEAARADVARLEAERDRLQAVIDANPSWAAYLTVADDAELRRYAEDLAREVRELRAERDEARAELEDRGKALAQYQLACGQHQAAAFEAEAAAERWLEVAHSHEMKLAAMRPVMEAAGDLFDAEHALEEADADSGEWKAAEQQRDPRLGCAR